MRKQEVCIYFRGSVSSENTFRARLSLERCILGFFLFSLICNHFVCVEDVIHKYIDVLLWSFGFSSVLYTRLKPALEILLLLDSRILLFHSKLLETAF